MSPPGWDIRKDTHIAAFRQFYFLFAQYPCVTGMASRYGPATDPGARDRVPLTAVKAKRGALP